MGNTNNGISSLGMQQTISENDITTKAQVKGSHGEENLATRKPRDKGNCFKRKDIKDGFKESSPPKSFKHKVQKIFYRKHVKFLCNKGYSEDEARYALKGNENDLVKSLNYLKHNMHIHPINDRPQYDANMLRHFKGLRASKTLLFAVAQMKKKAINARNQIQEIHIPTVYAKFEEGLAEVNYREHSSLLMTQRLKNFGLEEYAIKGDGNCQFRAMAHELYGDQDKFHEVRFAVVQRMKENFERFAIYFEDAASYKDYLHHMSKDKSWGDELTLRASADAFDVSIHVLTNTTGFGGWYLRYEPESSELGRHVFLSYQSPRHYNVLKPKKAEDHAQNRYSVPSKIDATQNYQHIMASKSPHCEGGIPKKPKGSPSEANYKDLSKGYSISSDFFGSPAGNSQRIFRSSGDGLGSRNPKYELKTPSADILNAAKDVFLKALKA